MQLEDKSTLNSKIRNQNKNKSEIQSKSTLRNMSKNTNKMKDKNTILQLDIDEDDKIFDQNDIRYNLDKEKNDSNYNINSNEVSLLNNLNKSIQ